MKLITFNNDINNIENSQAAGANDSESVMIVKWQTSSNNFHNGTMCKEHYLKQCSVHRHKQNEKQWQADMCDNTDLYAFTHSYDNTADMLSIFSD